MIRYHTDLTHLLDETHDRLHALDAHSIPKVVPATMHRLASETRTISLNLPSDEWADLVQQEVNPHPLVNLLTEDPYTARARSKPRGYAGDAVMMDYCYFTTPPEATSALGRAIFFFTTTSPNGQSVLDRLGIIASRIDSLAKRIRRPNILALACGHLREALLSSAFRTGRIGRMIALDQDEASLAIVKARYTPSSVECVSAKVRSILTGDMTFSDLDMVYAAGLFDYLDDSAAKLLTQRAFGFLRPGGQLLIGNFLPDTYGRGYMEAFMDWTLITRTGRQIVDLASQIDPTLIASRRYFVDDHRVIGYLVLTKRI